MEKSGSRNPPVYKRALPRQRFYTLRGKLAVSSHPTPFEVGEAGPRESIDYVVESKLLIVHTFAST